LGRIGGKEAETTLVSLLAELEQATALDEELCKMALGSLAGLRLPKYTSNLRHFRGAQLA
jgi:hypothetical protein